MDEDASAAAQRAQLPPISAMQDDRVRFRLADFVNYDKRRSRLWQAAWMATLETVFKRWWLPRRLRPPILRAFGATVGTNVTIRDGVHLFWPWCIEIGDDVWIGRDCQVITASKITIGHDVCISQQAMLVSSGHLPTSDDFRTYDFPIKVGNHVWIATRATILHRVRIPDHAVVHANAVLSFGQPIPRREDG